MKRVIGMLLLLGAVSFTACKNDGPAGGMIWDIAPICFDVYVQNAQGADLLNPTTEGNILEADIRALYEGRFTNGMPRWMRFVARPGLICPGLKACERTGT